MPSRCTRERPRTLIEAADCQLVFLPTYSPDFNPIEHAFDTIKQALFQIGARSRETIVAAAGAARTAITTDDAYAFFAAAGFPLPSQELCILH